VDRRSYSATVWVVYAREVGTAPTEETAIDWMLLTTYPVEDFADACLVIYGYTCRWPVEEYHRTWQSGACHVTETQLRSPDTLQKWGTILSSVAARLMHLRDLSRAEPSAPASIAYSEDEIEATILLRMPRDHEPATMPTLGRMTRWIAELGGYTGKSSGGPPGLIVLRRGLEQITPVAKALANQRQLRRDQC
jgi:Transposase Tn5 dimerisation domain